MSMSNWGAPPRRIYPRIPFTQEGWNKALNNSYKEQLRSGNKQNTPTQQELSNRFKKVPYIAVKTRKNRKSRRKNRR